MQEAIEAAARYERERPGLGAEFDDSAQAALDLLEEGIVPLAAAPSAARARGAQRLILRRFQLTAV